MMRMYLLDTNVFVEANKSYYRISNFGTFWSWLDAEQARGVIASIQMVGEELLDGDDELVAWTKEREQSGWFQPVDDEVPQLKYRDIADWVMSQPQYTWPNQTKFLSRADAWVIAKAAVTHATVVTLEIEVDMHSHQVKIPNVCRAFGVQYLNTFDMMQQLGAQF